MVYEMYQTRPVIRQITNEMLSLENSFDALKIFLSGISIFSVYVQSSKKLEFIFQSTSSLTNFVGLTGCLQIRYLNFPEAEIRFR